MRSTQADPVHSIPKESQKLSHHFAPRGLGDKNSQPILKGSLLVFAENRDGQAPIDKQPKALPGMPTTSTEKPLAKGSTVPFKRPIRRCALRLRKRQA